MAQKGKQVKDPDVEAANQIYLAGRADANQEIAKLKGEMEAIRLESQAIGILKKIEYDKVHNELLKYVVLLRLRESKEYSQGGMTWAQFCEDIVGEPKRTVNEKIADIRPFADRVWANFAQITGVTFSKIRYLGRSVGRESAQIEDDAIVFEDQRIPITPEHKDDIEALIDSIKESHKKQIEEQQATLRAKDKVLKDKEKLLNKQAKEIAKLEGRAEKLGYTPGEEALIQQMDNARTTIDGFLMQFDPERNPLPEDATPRMRAKLMHTLDYFKRVILATFDTAADLYGEPEMDDDWVPPHLRQAADETAATADDSEAPAGNCDACDYHKSQNNPAKGVKIPGRYGKCTRPEGRCNSADLEE